MNALIIGSLILIGLLFIRAAIVRKDGQALPFAFLIFVILASLGISAYAQTDNDATNAMANTAATVATPFIVTFAGKYPVLITVLAVVGFLRFVFKPMFSLLHGYTASTESTADDAYLDKVERNPVVKWLLWAVDWLGSIKVVAPKKQ